MNRSRQHTDSSRNAISTDSRLALRALAGSLMLAFGSNLYALPTGGAVSAGSASIAGGSGTVTINQTSQNVAINWQSFSIGKTEAVQFVQPNSSSVALNRVLGSDPSNILGSLSANGKVFLVNPNGILFGKGASVNVGGLVASTRDITDSDFMARNYKFSGTGNGTVVNQGTINADGGYVALLGANVSNEGVISARLGTVALVAGNAMTLDVAGDGLLNIAVNEGRMNALVQNGGLIQADGGQVLLTAQAAGGLLQTVVNNTGVIQAQTIDTRNGTIKLLGDMQSGTVNVGGTLDASAPNGGNGGFIETSAARVNVADSAHITTAAPMGHSGTWLIDPQDFIVATVGGNITPAALAAQLNLGNVTIDTNAAAGAGNGDIFFNNQMGGVGSIWNPGAGNPTTLTLTATRNVTFALGADITATNGSLVINAPGNVTLNAAMTFNTGNLVVCCGQDITLATTGSITTTNGSTILNAGRDITLLAGSTLTATDGNIAMCAGRDINDLGVVTITNGSLIPAQGLTGAPFFLRRGLTMSAGTAATGPGLAGGGGSVNITPVVTVTNAPVTVIYNPLSYSAPVTDFSLQFTAPTSLTVQRLVFPEVASKVADGTTNATLTGLFKPDAAGLRPIGISLSGGSTATFNTATAGVNKLVTLSGGSSLAGPNAALFSLPVNCCTNIARTSGDITAGGGTAPVGGALLPPILLAGPLTGLDFGVIGAGINLPPLLVAEAPPVEAPVVETAPPPAFGEFRVIAPAPVALPPRRTRN